MVANFSHEHLFSLFWGIKPYRIKLTVNIKKKSNETFFSFELGDNDLLNFTQHRFLENLFQFARGAYFFIYNLYDIKVIYSILRL